MQYTTEAAKYSVCRKSDGLRTCENNVRKIGSVFLYSCLQCTFADDGRRESCNAQKLKKTTETFNTGNWPIHSVEYLSEC
jgi:hypothetical protein